TSYNREKYIAEAIESVLRSSYTNYELIICDDRSTDRTVEIARSYAARDPRIKVYVNEKNLGDYPNRNRVASYARGKYLKYQDSDDIIYPHTLQIMVDHMENFPEVSVAFCGNEIQDYSQPYPVCFSPQEAYRTHFFDRNSLFYQGPVATIIRRETFERYGPFSGVRYVGDAEMWMIFARYTPVLKIQPGLIWWRTHPGQEFSMGTEDYVLLKYQLNKQVLEHPDCPLTEVERNAALGNNRRLLGRKILRLVFGRLAISSAIKLYRDAGLKPAILLESVIPVNRLKRLNGKLARP
ncbi:MAG TPA: glycosyltransferase family 2 protein, partial [Puia sp.]|nr:glycosyltransferase family 2 protein [Puia sp.]